jgi:hypothetical protein
VLLISTWETIAVMLSNVKRKDRAFRVLPICHMYRELQAAIKQLGEGANTAELGRLYQQYEEWLKSRALDADSVSALCGGLHARFG